MVFVPNFEHDIFVSYAHVDDKPLPGVEKGWVTTLVGCLNIRLSQKLGRSDAYSLWMDHELKGHKPITSQILGSLRRTATMVVVLSPGYVYSEWCRREKDTFLDLLSDTENTRVFVVEREKVHDSERPNEFGELKGFRFWVQDREGKSARILGSPEPLTTDQEYYNLIDDLSEEMANELRRLKAVQEQTSFPSAPDQPKVFLAQVTDDLETERSNVKRYLNQSGIRVLPETWYRQDPAEFKQAVERDLAQCEMFVQLLSETPGRRPPDLPNGYSNLQFECAQATGKPIMQWRSPDIDLAEIDDPVHRALLEATTVRAQGIEDFKNEVRRRVLEKPGQPPEQSVNAVVFVDMETADQNLAERVCEVVDHYGADYVVPVQSDDPAENRRDVEQNLLYCDAVIVVYGKTSPTWVKRQLLECRKIAALRETPLHWLAVFEGPPEEKDDLGIKLRNMSVLDCRTGFEQAEIESFLAGVSGGVA